MSDADSTSTTATEGGTPQQQQPSADYIKLKFVGQDSSEVDFCVKYSRRMRKLKKDYAKCTGVNLATLHFLFDGHLVEDDSTPESLEMEDDDVIEAINVRASPDLCAVCGDIASGINYGATSCSPCKLFFRRTYSENIQDTYTCFFSKACTVDKTKRKKCQFCRLQKCLMEGMKPEAIKKFRFRVKNEPSIDHRNSHHSMPRRSHSTTSDKEEMLQIMRRREEDHQKYEEELKFKYEREKLKREKLELEMENNKLQAQLAQANQLAAGIPLAAPASTLIGSNSAVQHFISQSQRIDASHRRKESPKDDHKPAPRHQSKEREITKKVYLWKEQDFHQHRHDHDSLSRMSSSHDRDCRGSGRLTDHQSNNSRTKSNRSHSPLYRNEATRGNNRRASQISNKDSRTSKYDRRNEDPHQKRANRGGPSSEITTDRTMGTSQPFITGHYNKRSYYADDGTNIDNRNYSTERQHPLIHSPQDHGTHRKISSQPHEGEIFPNDHRFGSETEITAQSYMAAIKTDTSYASRIAQSQQPISPPTDMAFGNPFGMNSTNQQRGGTTNYTQTQYGREPASNSHGFGFLQNSNWDTPNSRGGSFAISTNSNPRNVSESERNWISHAGTSTSQRASTPAGGRMQNNMSEAKVHPTLPEDVIKDP